MKPTIPSLPKLSDSVAELRIHYADNESLLGNSDAVYAIPSDALSAIYTSPLFSERQWKAERAFTTFCDTQKCIGIRGEFAIRYDHLCSVPITLDQEEKTRIEGHWSPDCISNLNELNEKLFVTRERVLGFAGWLVTAPQFLTETSALRLRYEALSVEDRRLSWPLQRAVRRGSGVTGPHAGPELSEFARALRAYLDRWDLMQLADWHLPEPQGMLLPGSLPPGAPAEPPHGVSLTVPTHLHLQHSDDIRGLLESHQKEAALAAGLPAEMAAIANHQQFAQLFRIHLMEAAILSRWTGHPPHGSADLLELAAEAMLGLAKPTVRRMRTWMRQLRSGAIKKIPRNKP